MARWQINLYTLWLTQIISLSSFGLGIPFIPFYIQEMGITDPNQIKLYTGILSFAPAVTMAFAAPIWGMLADRWGRKLMILRAMLSASIIIGAMAFATQAWQLILLRGAQGLFTGTVTASSAFVASNTPENRLSSALGFMTSSTFIGFSLGPVIGGYLAELFGIQASFLIGGGLMFIGFLMVLFSVKEDKTTYGKAIEAHNERISTRSIITPLICMFLIVLFIDRITRSLFTPFVPLFIQNMLGSSQGAAKLTGIINGAAGLATAIAGLTITRKADGCDKLTLIARLFIISILISIPLIVVNQFNLFIILYGLMYLFLGAIEPIVTSTTAILTPPSKRGALFGIQGFVGSMGWTLSPLIGTYVSLQFSIKSILLLMPILMLLNAIIVFKIILDRDRKNLSE